MKNRILCMILFLVLCWPGATARAQRIYFSDTTNIWKTINDIYPQGWPGIVVYEDFHISDTVIEWNGYIYSLLRSDQYEAEALVRDDTLQHKVFIKPLNWDTKTQYRVTDTGEFLWMDYTLEANDTFVLPLVYLFSADSFTNQVVLSVDSVLIENSWYKKFRIRAGSGLYNQEYELIEGVGSEWGPFLYKDGMSEWGHQSLYCFSNNGRIPPVFNESCLTLSINEASLKKEVVLITPNPVRDRIRISPSDPYAGPLNVMITDMFGRIWLEHLVRKETDISTEKIPPGIYVVRAFRDGTSVITKKIIISRF